MLASDRRPKPKQAPDFQSTEFSLEQQGGHWFVKTAKGTTELPVPPNTNRRGAFILAAAAINGADVPTALRWLEPSPL